MVEGKALISFGFNTTLMLGGTGTYCDSPAVSLAFRSREPGPLTDAEKTVIQTGEYRIDMNNFDVIMVFKTVKSIDNLIGLLTAAREELNDVLNKEE